MVNQNLSEEAIAEFLNAFAKAIVEDDWLEEEESADDQEEEQEE